MKVISTTKQYNYKNYKEFKKHWEKIQEDNKTRTSKYIHLLEHYPIYGATEEDKHTYTAIYTAGRCF